MIKYFKFLIKIFNFLIFTFHFALCNELKQSSSSVNNIREIFSSENISELFSYPSLIKDYSLSGISIVEFNVDIHGQINDIEILKSLGQPFDEAIFNGLNTFTTHKILHKKILKGFRYRLPIYFKN
ncbi:MAG: hypothetical protein CMF94_04855 [Candidatus Marinimicrobia bacterium]|nr:hypothetical protein [Candidatus Neomarinimicrobiota bacterium]